MLCINHLGAGLHKLGMHFSPFTAVLRRLTTSMTGTLTTWNHLLLQLSVVAFRNVRCCYAMERAACLFYSTAIMNHLVIMGFKLVYKHWRLAQSSNSSANQQFSNSRNKISSFKLHLPKEDEFQHDHHPQYHRLPGPGISNGVSTTYRCTYREERCTYKWTYRCTGGKQYNLFFFKLNRTS